MQSLKARVERYFHEANDRLGGHRAYFLYSISRDGLKILINLRKADWEAVPSRVRKASVEDATRWWKKNCLDPKQTCQIGIYDDHGTAILALPTSAPKRNRSP